MEQLTSKRRSAMVALGSACLIWGLQPVATRYLLRTLSIAELLGTRYGVTLLITLPFVVRYRLWRWPHRDLLEAVGWALGGIVGYQIVVTYALHFTTASSTGLIQGTEPVIVLLISMAYSRKLESTKILIASALGIAGVVAIFQGGTTGGRGAVIGDLLAAGSAVLWATYVVGTRRLATEHGAAALTVSSIAVGAFMLCIPYGHAIPESIRTASTSTLIVVAAIAVTSSVIAFFAWNWGASKLTSVEAGLFLYSIPALATIGGVIFLGERLSTSMILGAVLIAASIALSQVAGVTTHSSRRAMTVLRTDEDDLCISTTADAGPSFPSRRPWRRSNSHRA